MVESFAEFLEKGGFSRITCVRCGFPNLKAGKLLLAKDLGEFFALESLRLNGKGFNEAGALLRSYAVGCLGEVETVKVIEEALK